MRINFDKIICINLDSVNAQQLFAICETYFIGFEELYRRKTDTKVSMYWMTESKVVAFVIGGFFRMGSDFESVSLEDQERLKKIKPIKTPKMPKTEQAVKNYKAFLDEGYEKIENHQLVWLWCIYHLWCFKPCYAYRYYQFCYRTYKFVLPA